jgi:PAS domain S-box-containing protein
MTGSIFIGLIQNIAVLLTFTLIYEYFWNKNEDIQKNSDKIITGIIIGLIGIFLMYIPWTLKEGLVFDTRSVLLSISGLFFGVVPTLIAMTMTAAYRIIIGGSGVTMGVAVVLTSGAIGLVWRHFFPPRNIKKPFWNLLFLGLLVHVVMLMCTLLLPKNVFLETLLAIALPLLLIYTPGTMLLGLLMLKRWSIWQDRKDKEESEKKYRDLVENAGEAIAVTQDGVFRFANRKVQEILQYPMEEILTRSFLDYIHPEDKEDVYEHYRKRINGEMVPGRSDFRVIDKKGNVKWIELNAVVIDWEKRPAVLNFFSDMTAYRETQLQLRLAKEKAEGSDKLKSVFLANMSHEIRTPMNAITGFSDLLIHQDLSKEKQREFLQMIHFSGERLLHIIDDIVDLSKLETGTLKIDKSPFRLCDLFNKSLAAFSNHRKFLEKKDLELRMNCPDELKHLQIISDPHRLQQIVDNLLENAIKFTDKGYIELSCNIAKTDGENTLRIEVRDTGRGISRGKQDLIFERFRQVEENGYHEGAGLGLSICRGLAELMGGHIGVESTPGKGSCFTLTIPLEIAGPGQDTLNDSTIPVPDLSGLSVLLVEDDPGSARLLEEYLKPCGVKPAIVSDGKALMASLEKRVPDLILLDINLPEKDGLSCLREIQQKGYKSKIIAQTAYAMPEEKKRCLESGCGGYLSKPLVPAVFYREIQRVLRKESL